MSLQLKAFISKYSVIVATVAPLIDTVTSQCVEKELICEETDQKVTELNRPNSAKARMVLSEVRSKIKSESRKFYVFLEVLDKNLTCQGLAKELEKELHVLTERSQKDQASELPGASSNDKEIAKGSIAPAEESQLQKHHTKGHSHISSEMVVLTSSDINKQALHPECSVKEESHLKDIIKLKEDELNECREKIEEYEYIQSSLRQQLDQYKHAVSRGERRINEYEEAIRRNEISMKEQEKERKRLEAKCNTLHHTYDEIRQKCERLEREEKKNKREIVKRDRKQKETEEKNEKEKKEREGEWKKERERERKKDEKEMKEREREQKKRCACISILVILALILAVVVIVYCNKENNFRCIIDLVTFYTGL